MSHIIWKYSLIATLCAAGLSCDTGVQPNEQLPIEFVTAQSTYAAGDTLEAELRNNSSVAITYSFCSTALERLEAGSWNVVDYSLLSPTGE
jgi:hypothetical protein